ncbi:GNAT family N-acetyltransferase [Streptomyces sp. NPDC057748]|uniref:GNAT family N-acetyltransferase n=1 Tax=unclassified Streptomyces TaxID=2593676 RepID=UPI0036760AC8
MRPCSTELLCLIVEFAGGPAMNRANQASGAVTGQRPGPPDSVSMNALFRRFASPAPGSAPQAPVDEPRDTDVHAGPLVRRGGRAEEPDFPEVQVHARTRLRRPSTSRSQVRGVVAALGTGRYQAVLGEQVRLGEVEVHAFDDASLALYRKLGFIEEGRLRQHEFFAGSHHGVVLLGITADEYRATHRCPAVR